MTANLLAFAAAAFFEIAGCFAFWAWLRRGASPAIALLGVGSLMAFAVTLTKVDTAFAGRAYAAYGGIYIAGSLMWLWMAEGQRPTIMDLFGAGIAIAGALLIIVFAPKAPWERRRLIRGGDTERLRRRDDRSSAARRHDDQFRSIGRTPARESKYRAVDEGKYADPLEPLNVEAAARCIGEYASHELPPGKVCQCT